MADRTVTYDVPPADDYADLITQAELDSAGLHEEARSNTGDKTMADTANTEAPAGTMADPIVHPKKPRARKVKKAVNPNAPKCLNPDCGKPAGTRGLCGSCYSTASALVKDGTTTWAALEAKGKAQGRGGVGGTLKAKAKAWLMAE